jgi:hypothetical protein
VIHALRLLFLLLALLWAGLPEASAYATRGLENRVWKNFDLPAQTALDDALQVLEPQQEIWVLLYDPASGSTVWTHFDPEGLQKKDDKDDDDAPKLSRSQLNRFQRKLDKANAVAKSAKDNNKEVEEHVEREGNIEYRGSKEFIDAAKYGVKLLKKVDGNVKEMVNSMENPADPGSDIVHRISQSLSGASISSPDNYSYGFPSSTGITWNTHQGNSPEERLGTLAHEKQHSYDAGAGAPESWYSSQGRNAPISEQRGMRAEGQVLQAAGWDPRSLPDQHAKGSVPNVSQPVDLRVPKPYTDKNLSPSQREGMLKSMERERINNLMKQYQ